MTTLYLILLCWLAGAVIAVVTVAALVALFFLTIPIQMWLDGKPWEDYLP